MKKTYQILKLLIGVLLLAVLILGATLLYNRLSEGMDQPLAMVTVATEAPETTQTPEETVPAGTGETAAPEETEASNAAPDFTVYDLEGNPHKLSDFQGKPVILNFWASWCGPCKSEMPEFQNFYDTYGEQIHFLVVNLTDGHQETVETASAFIADHGYTFPVYYDTDMEAATAYGVNAVPVTYFIDAEGNFVAYAQGALNASRFQQGVDMIFGE